VQRQNPQAGARVDEGSTITLIVSAGPGEVAVPDVTGLRVATARDRLEEEALQVRVREEFSSDVPRGRVIETTPAAGIKVEKGKQVTLVVSAGVEQAEVPDVVGIDEAQAEERLVETGFNVRIIEEVSDEDPGTVLTQNIPAGSEEDRGTTVEITVATRGERVTVPNLVGMSISDASAELSERDLTMRVSTRGIDDSADQGQVISQRPDPGSEVLKGTSVNVTIGLLKASAAVEAERQQ
jgi:serine/threonine-protein kinase